MSFVLHGIGVSGGIAIGRAQLISHATLEVAHYSITPEQVSGEIERLTQALHAVQKELETLHGAMTSGDAPAEFGAFLDVHWMILTDPTLHEVPKRTIAEQLCNAEWALTQQLGVLIEQFDMIEDPYLRERKADVAHVLELEWQKLRRLRTTPATTLDDHKVELMANIELPDDLEQSLENGATGVGLFRTEFLFLNRDGLPSEDEQFEAYRAVAAGMKGQPVTIRTFDLGADKHKEGLDGLTRVAPNPALGLRAIRFCLAEPRLFLTQLRAILRASRYGKVKILLPMLSSVGEIEQSLVLIAQAKESLREQKVRFDPGIEVGGMIEIPAAVLSIGAFTTRLDFLSIGTNDLIQYTLAVDRADDAVSQLYDALHPAVIKLIALAIATANKAEVPIAVCGEMAGEARLTRLLLGMGLTNFSMHPAHLLSIKQRVLASDIGVAKPIVGRMRRTDEPAKLVALLEKLNAG